MIFLYGLYLNSLCSKAAIKVYYVNILQYNKGNLVSLTVAAILHHRITRAVRCGQSSDPVYLEGC